MPQIDFKRVKQLVNTLDCLRILGWVSIAEGPGKVRCACPMVRHTRDEERPVAVNLGGWYCHKCKRGGDAVDFVSAALGLPIAEAARALCRLVGVRVPYLPRSRRTARRRERGRGTVGGAGGIPPDPHS
jgi:hypothetical protein